MTDEELNKAAEYSFNIQSKLFHLLSEEQQILWKKEIEQAYLAGAELQKQHDAELIEIAYNDGITIGMTKQKKQMLEEAVEGEIVKDISNKLAVTAKNVNLDGFKFGDKVRIIIVKDNN